MSDDVEVLETTAVLQASEESRTWAHKLMSGVRAVQELHQPAEMTTDEDDTVVVGCSECSRIATDEIEEWPCATATALGIAEGPLL